MGRARDEMTRILKLRGQPIVVAGRRQAIAAGEDIVELARHVEGGKQGPKGSHIERHLRKRPGVCSVKYGVLAPEAGEEWKPTEREHTGGVGIEGDSHVLAQTAHGECPARRSSRGSLIRRRGRATP